MGTCVFLFGVLEGLCLQLAERNGLGTRRKATGALFLHTVVSLWNSGPEKFSEAPVMPTVAKNLQVGHIITR